MTITANITSVFTISYVPSKPVIASFYKFRNKSLISIPYYFLYFLHFKINIFSYYKNIPQVGHTIAKNNIFFKIKEK
jgi:hypothetical protein